MTCAPTRTMERQATGIIEARAPVAAIRRAYNMISLVYARLAGPLERKPRMMALERARIRPGDRVLEVAVGPGSTLVEIVKLVGPGTLVYGVDLSPNMLKQTRGRVARTGHTDVILREADARQLPFPDESFDVLYNSYMLDLIPLGEMPVVLAEFRRVLKPGGRLALVNFSKKDLSRRTWYERLYLGLPVSWVPYLLGGCRPVLLRDAVEAAGFADATREFVRHAIPSEIVVARKAAGG